MITASLVRWWIKQMFNMTQKLPQSIYQRMTPKQKEVLALVAQGHNNDSIADELNISTRTVDRHLNEIYRHLRPHLAPGVHARVNAVLLFLSESDPTAG